MKLKKIINRTPQNKNSSINACPSERTTIYIKKIPKIDRPQYSADYYYRPLHYDSSQIFE